MKVKITQTCRVERLVVLDVNAPDIETARTMLENDELPLPMFDDPVWTSYWDLLEETIEPASEEFHFEKGVPCKT